MPPQQKPSRAPAKAPELPGGASLLTSAALPSTATVVTVVTGAAAGADFMMRSLFLYSGFVTAVIFFSAIVSFFATFAAASLPLMWKIGLWPVNFCVLLYLVVSSSFFIDKVNQDSKQANIPPVSHIVSQQVIPGANP